jgi:hypothetical protein
MRKLTHITALFIIAVTSTIFTPTASAGGWQRVSFRMGAPTKYWEQIASCEAGKPANQVDWSKPGTYAGGLTIHHNANFGDPNMGIWEMYGGEVFASSPDKATKQEQIIVANRIANTGYKTFVIKNVSPEGQPPLNKKVRYKRGPIGYKAWPCVVRKEVAPYYKDTYTVSLPNDKSQYCPKYEELFRKYGLPVKVFSYIAYRESRCNPGAINARFKNGKIVWTLNKNGTYDNGLLQINSSWFRTLREHTIYEPKDLYNAEVNALFANWILNNTSSRLGNWSIRAS